MTENLPPIEPLTVPVAYLVPLRDEGQPAHSYVFAFTRWLSRPEADEYLPAASNWTGNSIPYRASEVVQFPLNPDGLATLPANLFARELIQSFDWRNAQPGQLAAAFAKRYGQGGYPIPVSGFTVILREGAIPADNVMGFPPGECAVWRDARATVCVDLDGLVRNETLGALQAILSPLITAAGTVGLESQILGGRALKWDATLGRLLSPDETSAAYQQERVAMLDQLGDTDFRKPVYRFRLPKVNPEVRARAESQGHSIIEEWREARRRNLAIELPSRVAENFAQFATRIASTPPRPLADWAEEFTQLQTEFKRQLRAALNRAMTEDYLGDPAWRRRSKEVELADNIPADQPERGSDAGRSDDDLLADTYGRELVTRAHWTPTEIRVLAAIARLQKGETLASWARQNGMDPTTARVHKSSALKKLERAKKLP